MLRLLEHAEGGCRLTILQGFHWHQDARGQHDIAFRNFDSLAVRCSPALTAKGGVHLLMCGLYSHLGHTVFALKRSQREQCVTQLACTCSQVWYRGWFLPKGALEGDAACRSEGALSLCARSSLAGMFSAQLPLHIS